MALVQSTLANGLAGLTPVSVEATAASNFANAWATYFAGASVTGVPVGNISSAKSAFQSALSGFSVANAGPAKIQAAVIAFWGVIAPSGATLWIISPNTVTLVTPPPTMSGIAAALTSVFSANAADPTKTLAQATSAIAAVLHANGGLGAIATVQPPPVSSPIPTPIL
jgi:hypothetical protein